MATIVFLHGLNTFGDDLIHLGPLSFGPMSAHLEQAFLARQIDFIGVPGIGAGTPAEQARIALEFLLTHPILGALSHEQSVTLFGQSTGGLVARVLATLPEMRQKVDRIITMGSPHGGAEIANFALNFKSRHPLLQKTLRALGYDTEAKSGFFEHFTTDKVAKFNSELEPSGVPEISLLCEVDSTDVSFPLQLLGRITRGSTLKRGDGFISSTSQCRGEVLGPFVLDHFAQLGAFFHLSKAARRRSQLEFERLIENVARIASSS